jgi:hypothetical protein
VKIPPPGTAILLVVGEQTWRTKLVLGGSDGLLLDVGDLVPESLRALTLGRMMQCRYHETESLTTFQCAFKGFQRSADRRELLLLGEPDSVVRNQRRQHVRVSRKIPIQLQLKLRNDQLSRSLGKEYAYKCWVEGEAINISAGGFRAALSLPMHHSVANHRDALIRFDLNDRRFRDRRLDFIRRDWSSEENIIVYRFGDLSHDEIVWLEQNNSSWLHNAKEHDTDKDGKE